MSFITKSFQSLTTAELYSILKVRTEVFVVEQNCPYLEVDGKDGESYHIFKRIDGEIAAYARVLPQGVSYEEVSIGRVLVAQKYRKEGLGRQLMEAAIQFAHIKFGKQPIKIQAQAYLQSFYESLGFKVISEAYLEDDIPHIDMLLDK